MTVLEQLRESATATAARAVRCQRCGLSLSEAAVQRDLVLVLASCCPRCDGPLEQTNAPRFDPAIHLG